MTGTLYYDNTRVAFLCILNIKQGRKTPKKINLMSYFFITDRCKSKREFISTCSLKKKKKCPFWYFLCKKTYRIKFFCIKYVYKVKPECSVSRCFQASRGSSIFLYFLYFIFGIGKILFFLKSPKYSSFFLYFEKNIADPPLFEIFLAWENIL